MVAFEGRSPEFREFMKVVYESAESREAASQSLQGVRETIDSFAGFFELDRDILVEPATCDGVPAEWVVAPESDAGRVVLYAHGGCYISGSPAVVREFCARLARASKSRVLSIDYRLAPEHPFPAAVEDMVGSYRWLLTRGFTPERVAVAGESAGGGLTFATLLSCRDRDLPMPACGVALSPWVDMDVSFGKSLVRNEGIDMASVEPLRIGAEAYAGKGNRRNPLAAPLYADLAGLPPLLVQVGTNEVLLDEGLEIARRARRAGCDVTLQPWDDMVHVWHWYGSLFPEARESIAAIGSYLTGRLAGR